MPMNKTSTKTKALDETLDYANMNAEQRIAYLAEEKKKREAAKALKLKNAKKTGFRAGMRSMFNKDAGKSPPPSSQSTSRATSSTVTRKVVTTKPATTTTTETVVQETKATPASTPKSQTPVSPPPVVHVSPPASAPPSRPTSAPSSPYRREQERPGYNSSGTKKWVVDTSYVAAATNDVEVLRNHKYGKDAIEYEDPEDYECTAHHIVYGNDPLIDPKRKEEYLGDQEFELIFGKDKNKFYNMPLYKQQNAKAEQGWQ